MKMFVLIGAAVLAVGLSASALAAPPASTANTKEHHFADAVKKVAGEKFTTGTVTKYDASTRKLDLSMGGPFKLAPAVATAPSVGKKVTVRWTMKDGERIADQIKAD